jgi:hypothetical protein
MELDRIQKQVERYKGSELSHSRIRERTGDRFDEVDDLRLEDGLLAFSEFGYNYVFHPNQIDHIVVWDKQ